MKRAVWLATLMWCWMGTMSVQANDHDVAEMLAKQEIEYLQTVSYTHLTLPTKA